MRAFYRMDAELIVIQVKQLNRQMQRFSNPPLLCHVNKYDLHQLKSQGPQLVWILCFPAMVVLHNSFCSCGGTYGCLFVCVFNFPKSSPHLQSYSCASKKGRWRVSPLTCSLAITITWTLPHALSLQAQPNAGSISLPLHSLHILEIHAHYWKQALHRQTYCKQSCLNKMVSGDWALGGFGLCPVTNESHAWSDSSFCPATTWMDLVW